MSPKPTTSRRPQSSPTRSSWTRRRSSPTVFCGPRLRRCCTRGFASHRAQAYHSLREDLSVSLSSSSMSDRTGRPVGDRTGRPVEKRNQEAQIRALLDKQKGQILAECQRQKKSTKIGWNCWFSTRRTSSRSSRRSSTTRSTASSRTIIAAKVGITWSSSEKFHWNGRVTEVSEFYIRHYCKTKTSRGSENILAEYRNCKMK